MTKQSSTHRRTCCEIILHFSHLMLPHSGPAACYQKRDLVPCHLGSIYTTFSVYLRPGGLSLVSLWPSLPLESNHFMLPPSAHPCPHSWMHASETTPFGLDTHQVCVCVKCASLSYRLRGICNPPPNQEGWERVIVDFIHPCP